jgi:2-aminoethylphosphonate-pyruvate transaminase
MTGHAIILAAGQGVRLRAIVEDRPKGLIEIGGETLVGRSIRLLRAAGVRRITIVAGYLAEQYARLAVQDAEISVATNGAFATTGSMASLAAALFVTPAEDVLVLESDIIYDTRALPSILPILDATLVSGPTDAGDEVWVDAIDDRLRAMSKDRRQVSSVIGEFVGITHLSRAAADAMRAEFGAFVAAHGHGRMDYETGALVKVARRVPIRTVLVPDLQWGEIDDERHYARVTSMDWSER